MSMIFFGGLASPVAYGVSTGGGSGGGGSTALAQRAPTATDDSTKSYNVGDFWNNTTTGNIYRATSVTTGAAVWVQQTTINTLMLDTVTGAQGGYGTFKMRSAYAGNAFKVQRSSDNTTLDIGFLGNGVADFATADAFATAGGAGTLLGVTTWYDQSGNGYDLTQTTFANMPRIYTNAAIGSQRAITFDGANASNTTRTMKNTALPTSNVQNFTVLTLARQFNDLNSNAAGVGMWEIGSPTNKYTIFQDVTGSSDGLKYTPDGGSFGNFGTFAATSATCDVLSSTAGVSVYKQNNLANTASYTNGTASAATGIYLGNTVLASTYNGQQDITCFVIYNSALSSANQASLQQVAYQTSGIAPQIVETVGFIGNSITYGIGANTAGGDATYSSVVTNALYNQLNFFCMGVPSITAASVRATISDLVAKYKRANATNIAVVYLGTNDLANNDTVSNTYGYLQTICSSLKSGGINKIVIVTTICRDANFSGITAAQFETNRLSLNSMIVSNYATFADALANAGADANLGGGTASADNTTYFADKIHPTPVGAAILANYIKAAIQSIM